MESISGSATAAVVISRDRSFESVRCRAARVRSRANDVSNTSTSKQNIDRRRVGGRMFLRVPAAVAGHVVSIENPFTQCGTCSSILEHVSVALAAGAFSFIFFFANTNTCEIFAEAFFSFSPRSPLSTKFHLCSINIHFLISS